MIKRILLGILVPVIGLALMAGCRPDLSSPAKAYEALMEAHYRSDAEQIKQVITADSLKRFEEGAKKQNRTLEEEIKAVVIVERGRGGIPAISDLGTETIKGDTAHIMIRGGRDTGLVMTGFVKEGGRWKVTYPLTFKQPFQVSSLRR